MASRPRAERGASDDGGRGLGDRAWHTFARRYRSEMTRPAPARLLDLLAALSHTAHLSVGCYCEREDRCHRSILRALLAERGASIV